MSMENVRKSLSLLDAASKKVKRLEKQLEEARQAEETAHAKVQVEVANMKSGVVAEEAAATSDEVDEDIA